MVAERRLGRSTFEMGEHETREPLAEALARLHVGAFLGLAPEQRPYDGLGEERERPQQHGEVRVLERGTWSLGIDARGASGVRGLRHRQQALWIGAGDPSLEREERHHARVPTWAQHLEEAFEERDRRRLA